jgi:CarD family transcriptional regulator
LIKAASSKKPVKTSVVNTVALKTTKKIMVLSDPDFRAGDMVVYPGHGVGKISALHSKLLAGTEQKLFEIVVSESGMKIMVPVAQARGVGLRKVADKKTVDKVYSILKDRKGAKIDTQTWNRRFREYSQKIKTGSVVEIAEVLRDLSVLSSGKELSFGEKRMRETAQNLLVSEIAIAKARTHDKIRTELQAIFN